MFYACCPEPYVDVTFTLKIKRRPEIYAYILSLPSLVASMLLLSMFWLPPTSGSRFAVGGFSLFILIPLLSYLYLLLGTKFAVIPYAIRCISFIIALVGFAIIETIILHNVSTCQY